MHEILLPAFNLSSPSKDDCFECLDNIAVVLKGPQHAGTPLATPDQSTTGSETGKRRTRAISAPAICDINELYQNPLFLSKNQTSP